MKYKKYKVIEGMRVQRIITSIFVEIGGYGVQIVIEKSISALPEFSENMENQ